MIRVFFAIAMVLSVPLNIMGGETPMVLTRHDTEGPSGRATTQSMRSIKPNIEVGTATQTIPAPPTEVKSSQIRIYEIDELGNKLDTVAIKAQEAKNGDLYLIEALNTDGALLSKSYYRIFRVDTKGLRAQLVELNEEAQKDMKIQTQVRKNRIAINEGATKRAQVVIDRAKAIAEMRAKEAEQKQRAESLALEAKREAERQQAAQKLAQLRAEQDHKIDVALLAAHIQEKNRIEQVYNAKFRLSAAAKESNSESNAFVQLNESDLVAPRARIAKLENEIRNLSAKTNVRVQQTPLSESNVARAIKDKIDKDSDYIASGQRIAAAWAGLREKHQREDREMAQKGPLDYTFDYSQYRIGGKDTPPIPTIFNKMEYPSGYQAKHIDVDVLGNPQGNMKRAIERGDWDPKTRTRISDSYREQGEPQEFYDSDELGNPMGRTKELIKSGEWDEVFMKPKDKLTDLNKKFYQNYPEFIK